MPGRLPPMGVRRDQARAADRDRLAVLAVERRRLRRRPAPAVGRAPRDVDREVAAGHAVERPEHRHELAGLRVGREALVPEERLVARVRGDDHVLGPRRAAVVGQAEHRARNALARVLVGLPVLERLGERAVGEPQQRTGGRGGGMRQVDRARRAPVPAAVGRGRVVVAHRQQALRLRVDPRPRRVGAVGPEGRGRQDAGLELGELERARLADHAVEPPLAAGRGGATPMSRRDPATRGAPGGRRPTRARSRAGTWRRACRRTRGTPTCATPTARWRARRTCRRRCRR